MSVEVDENQLRELQALAAQVPHLKNYETVVNAVRRDPDARKLFNASVKKISPNTPIPEFDAHAAFHGAAQKLEEKFQPVVKTITDFIDNQNKQKIETDTSTQIASGHQLLRSRGFNKEGIEAVEKLMRDEGIASYAAGAALFTERNPPEQMAVPGSQSAFDVFAGTETNAAEEFKAWASGPKGREGTARANQEIRKVLAEIRSGGRAA